MAVIRSAGIVDHQITRDWRIRIVVSRARKRLPKMGGEIPFKILFGEKGAQCLSRRKAAVLSDAACKPRRQRVKRAAEVSARVHAPHQTFGLLHRVAGKAQRLRIKPAGAHVFENDQRPRVSGLALVAQGRSGGGRQHRAGQSDRDDAGGRTRPAKGKLRGFCPKGQARRAVKFCRRAHGFDPNPESSPLSVTTPDLPSGAMSSTSEICVKLSPARYAGRGYPRCERMFRLEA